MFTYTPETDTPAVCPPPFAWDAPLRIDEDAGMTGPDPAPDPRAEAYVARLLDPTLPHPMVLRIVSELMTPMIEQAGDDYDVSVVVLRGGGLMAPSLRRAGHRVVGMRPAAPLPTALRDAERILLCAPLASTGRTCAHLIQRLRAQHPNALIDVMTVFAADRARARIDAMVGRCFVARRIAADAVCTVAMDIPFDFGDVAQSCGLSRVDQIADDAEITGAVSDVAETRVHVDQGHPFRGLELDASWARIVDRREPAALRPPLSGRGGPRRPPTRPGR